MQASRTVSQRSPRPYSVVSALKTYQQTYNSEVAEVFTESREKNFNLKLTRDQTSSLHGGAFHNLIVEQDVDVIGLIEGKRVDAVEARDLAR